jgi:CRP/FNR family transcriptional regulator, cyclic AMP receptor protein
LLFLTRIGFASVGGPNLRDIRAAMAATTFLEHVPAAAIDRLIAAGVVHHHRRGTYVCHQGDPSTEAYFLAAGRVEISSISHTGTRVLHASFDEPLFFGELGLLGDLARTASVLAMDDSAVWTAPADEFLAFLTSQPEAARATLRALARQVEAHEAFVDDLLFLDLKGRVAKRLLQLTTASLDDLPPDGTIAPGVTHADLASLCGGSRENVTRILTEFQRRGLIKRDGRRYVLRKVSGLAKLAGL